MARLFKREVSLAIAHPPVRSYGYLDTSTTIIRDMRVSFKIEKHLHSEPNTCHVTVSNLSEASRAEFQRKPTQVRLEAGYDGSTERLFTGDLRWCQSHIDGAEWLTELQVADGDRAHRFARVRRSFKAGVTTATAIEEVLRSMGVDMPAALKSSRALRKQYASGLSLEGASARQLTRLLKPLGLTWSMQDGRLQVLAEGDVRTDAPILVSQERGLIGSPEFGAPTEASVGPSGRERKARPPILSFRMLLYPGLTPGGRVQLDSRSIKGLFRIERVVHVGDTHGSDWHSEVEAKQVK